MPGRRAAALAAVALIAPACGSSARTQAQRPAAFRPAGVVRIGLAEVLWPLDPLRARGRDEITLAYEGDTDVTAISLWDTKEQAETYATTAYPELLKSLEKFLDGQPKVRVSKVINSTTHKVTAAAVVAA